MKKKTNFFKKLHEDFKLHPWKTYWITFIPFFIASLIMVIIADNGSGCGCDLETIASIVSYVGLIISFLPYIYYKFFLSARKIKTQKTKEKENDNEKENLE